jgi:hypothetical protein
MCKFSNDVLAANPSQSAIHALSLSGSVVRNKCLHVVLFAINSPNFVIFLDISRRSSIVAAFLTSFKKNFKIPFLHTGRCAVAVLLLIEIIQIVITHHHEQPLVGKTSNAKIMKWE